MRRSILVLSLVLSGTAIAAPLPELIAARGFAPGLYELSPRDAETRVTMPVQKICAGSLDELVRIGHSSAIGCRNQSFRDENQASVVTYSCPGQGSGRTEIRHEQSGDYSIYAQGVAAKQPFALRILARRSGSCSGDSASMARR